jgi:membrane-bound ClpP family serine protease
VRADDENGVCGGAFEHLGDFGFGHDGDALLLQTLVDVGVVDEGAYGIDLFAALFVNKLKTGKTKTNVDALIGEEAKVLTYIKPFEPGSIKLRGQEWTAVAKDDNLAIASGEVVKVVAIEGVKAIVKPQEK